MIASLLSDMRLICICQLGDATHSAHFTDYQVLQANSAGASVHQLEAGGRRDWGTASPEGGAVL